MKKTRFIAASLVLLSCISLPLSAGKKKEAKDVRAVIEQVNGYWQSHRKAEDIPFWHVAAYHTGNMEAYFLTGKKEYLDWFTRTLDYCKDHFSDPEYGEWYGYLRRDGLPTMPSTKGSTFKGPFHLPRMLITVDGILGELTE